MKLNNVIGYNGTPDDRMAKWLTMLMMRQSEEVFKTPANDNELKVKEQDRRVYKKVMENYISKAA